MKYSEKFLSDIKWYFKVRHFFNFDGIGYKDNYVNKKCNPIIIYDKNGIDGIESFFLYDTRGIITPTRHPNILHCLLKVKGSVNFHIKMYAEGRADCTFLLSELKNLCAELNSPLWFFYAIENQKLKFYKDKNNE